jgi:hypothetical protein
MQFIRIPIKCGSTNTLTEEEIRYKVEVEGCTREELEKAQKETFEYRVSRLRIDQIISYYPSVIEEGNTLIELISGRTLCTTESIDFIDNILKLYGVEVL